MLTITTGDGSNLENKPVVFVTARVAHSSTHYNHFELCILGASNCQRKRSVAYDCVRDCCSCFALIVHAQS